MSVLGDYLKNLYRDDFFIEIEGKPDVIERFLNEYNIHKQTNLSPFEGIVRLTEDQNKYGLEYRVYLRHIENIPAGITSITANRVYRREYPFRISKKEYVRPLLFEDDFNLGLNR